MSNIQTKLAVAATALSLASITGFFNYQIFLDFYAEQFVFPKSIRSADYGVTTFRDDTFKTSDGVTLGADIHKPKGLDKAPTILTRIPFNNTLWNRLRSDIIGRFWARRGYVVVVQGTRGRYRSTGDFYPAIYEAQDGTETLEWLQKQSWFNGQLAMWGGSAFGHTQWAVSGLDGLSPDIHAIQIVSTDYYGTFYPGGAFALESALYWALISPPDADRSTSIEEIEAGANGWPLIEADNRGFQNVKFFDDWVSHQKRDDYWQQIDGLDRAQNIDAPVLLFGGWFDPFLPTMLKDFKSLISENNNIEARESRLIIGPYGHANETAIGGEDVSEIYRISSLEPVLRWFDHWLANDPQGASAGPKVKIYVMGENIWRNENEWPLARTVYTPYYFSDSGTLSLSSAAEDVHVFEYSYDPNDPVATNGGAMLGPRSGMEQQTAPVNRSDILWFQSEILDADMEVTGPISAILHVETDRTNTDFTVKLVDVYTDGTAYNITDGIIRQNYTPGTPTEITVELAATSYLFRKGHRIRVDVSSSNFPRFDRNPNTGQNPAYEMNPIVAHQKLFVSQNHSSQIIFPVIPR